MGDDFVSPHVDALVARDPAVLAEVIARCVEIKARVVAADEFERTGVRAVLNYGHTRRARARDRDRPRVACTARRSRSASCSPRSSARCSNACRPTLVDAHRGAGAARSGCPTHAPPGLRADDLLAIMARDKKSGGGLTFVLDGPNGIERVDDPDPGAVRKALAAIRVEA